ncbi:MAG: asparagine synthase (glutamine-hydrolyzing) [Pseudomonadota bacterium]
MCGIVGVIQKNKPVDESMLCAMRDTFAYRGPDDKGIWIDDLNNFGFGHRRLSIIDPTPDGHQPMLDEETGNVIVFNGEVYNYLEIKEQLSKLGIVFKTHTDTEVILKAYRVYGIDCLQHFNGMFAIAIWDNASKSFFLSRDRLGVKPLYYYETENGDFAFASEVKAIRKYIGTSPLLNEHLIDEYMSFGYIPGEDTLLKGIKRLLPGHFAVLKDNKLDIKKYWDLEFDNSEDKGFDYYKDKTKALIDDSLDLRLRSDVPLGIFLSGGLDSSAVVALLAPRVTEPLKTFSVAYDFGRAFNETEYARIVSKKFNTDHHEILVEPKYFCDFIPKYIHLMDEPVTESAAISLHYVSQLASKHVKVVLSGEGSDEIYAGYDLYKYMLFIERYRKIAGKNGTKFIDYLTSKVLNPNNKIRKYAALATLPINQRYKGISAYDDRFKSELYNDNLKRIIINNSNKDEFIESLFSRVDNQDALSKMLYFDTKTWLVDDLLIKADRMSMASSIELRVPFLDYRLVELAAKTPSKYKVKNGNSKYILKKMMEGILPDEIIYRKKMGFPTPLSIMFKSNLKDYAYDTLLSSNTMILNYFNKGIINKLLDEHVSSKYDHHRTIWQLIVLEEWLKSNKD